MRLSSPRYLAEQCAKVPAVYRNICEKPLVKDNKAKVHFVDDRVETCRAVSECPELKDVSVYMADWWVSSGSAAMCSSSLACCSWLLEVNQTVLPYRGYSSAQMKEEGSALMGVTMIDLKQFKELIQWAILMGGERCFCFDLQKICAAEW